MNANRGSLFKKYLTRTKFRIAALPHGDSPNTKKLKKCARKIRREDVFVEIRSGSP
jgi:hypothetical protein